MNYNSIKVEGLNDKEVGKRIRAFAKRFFYISSVFLFLYSFLIFILLSDYSSKELIDSGSYIFCLFILFISTYLCFLATYFIYIKNVGFGIIANDINEIKIKLNETTSKDKVFYCTECGGEVKEEDAECPHCGSIFE